MLCGDVENRYTRKECEIVIISGDIISIKDKCGFIWDWKQENSENFAIGEKVNLKMYTNGTTNNINDDKILKIMR